MDKLQNLNMYINRIDEILNKEKSWDGADTLADTIIRLYQYEIPNLKDGFYFEEFEGKISLAYGHLDLLKAKLEHYASTVEEQRLRDELKTPTNQHITLSPNFTNTYQPTNNPTFNNSPYINVTSNSNATNTIDILYEQTLKNINDLDTISKEDKDLLLKYIKEAEDAKNSKDKETLSKKLGNILSFIAVKGVPVMNAVLPYVEGISKMMATLQ